MRLGLLVGAIIGGVIAIILKQSNPADPGPLGAVKRQVLEATEAAKEEAAEKEAKLMAEYEAAKRGEKPADQP
jgi:hypothetical protein